MSSLLLKETSIIPEPWRCVRHVVTRESGKTNFTWTCESHTLSPVGGIEVGGIEVLDLITQRTQFIRDKIDVKINRSRSIGNRQEDLYG